MRILLSLLNLFAACAAFGGNQAVFTVTAYCPCKICTGVYAGGPTASGVSPRQGVTIAASRAIRFGTVLEIEGVGRRVVQDRLALAYDDRIDIFFRNHAAAKRFGIRRMRVAEIRPN